MRGCLGLVSLGDKDSQGVVSKVLGFFLSYRKSAGVVVALLIALVIGGSLIFGYNRKADSPEIKQKQGELLVAANVGVAAPALPATKSTVILVKKNDTLSKVCKRFGIDERSAKRLLSLKQVKSLDALRVGDQITATFDQSSNSIQSLVYNVNPLKQLRINFKDGVPYAVINHIKPVVVVKYASSNVDRSIYSSAKKHGVSSKLMRQFVTIFSDKVNPKKISGSDRFSLFYKDYLVDGKKVKDSEILAAELTHRGTPHRIIAFKDKQGRSGFYTPDGRNIKSSFVRYPLSSFRKISSRFSMNRVHPIYGVVRPHLGVDFAASVGTPIKVTSNGKVVFAGNRSGYGRAVIVKNGIYSTLYAHMSRFATSSGKYVKQGDVIGYVGSSGSSTSPHLHYEFHVNGVHRDPLKVKLPGGEMIAKEYRNKFFALSKNIVAQLDAHHLANRSFAMHNAAIFE